MGKGCAPFHEDRVGFDLDPEPADEFTSCFPAQRLNQCFPASTSALEPPIGIEPMTSSLPWRRGGRAARYWLVEDENGVSRC